MSILAAEDPEVGQLVQARGQQWVVSAVDRSRQPLDELAPSELPGRTMVTLTSVSDDDLGEELSVIWEIEPGREVLPSSRLPEVTEEGWDDPQRLGAFLDAVRWGTVASADTRTLQAPFRSGIRIEEYQLEPVAKALEMPRVNLLIADDVGLGKTIEAGLIVQELLLRHRARRIIVVAPASLTGKWATEMIDRFGLAFEVLDSARLKELRRTHGLEANPFTVFPRTVISLQWLRSARIQRLLDEVLVPESRYPGFFDLLIVDEAHHCAPPAPSVGKRYALDSKQTKAVRRLGDHANHRLFLSATPHNGYAESWEALLEMIDPNRFLRGVEPDPRLVAEIMIRRLKDAIVDADGNPRFPARTTRAIEVTYTPQERRAHELLEQYSSLRRARPGRAAARMNDLVTLLLKKRLFSSPAAFAQTLHVHRASLGRDESAAHISEAVPEWLEEALGWDDPDDDISQDEHEDSLLDRVGEAVDVGATEMEVLEELKQWAEDHGDREDSKARALVSEIESICRLDGQWGNERLIVFTEYRDTLRYLAEILSARGLGGERLGLLYGGMDDARREHLKAAFQKPPEDVPLRILLATDAASEGIDLQNHCSRVLNYDIPFNPNRLEQRIGRVDRFGQRQAVEVTHFVGAGWESAPSGSYEADLEFLSRVATKVARERRDLGSINPVLASAVEARMLGLPTLVDPTEVEPKASTVALRAEQDLRAAATRIRAQLDESVQRLRVSPANVQRVVDTALALAGQPALRYEEGGLVAPPTLRGGWERTIEGLADPYDGHRRHFTFDSAVAAAYEDVVLAHLEHPLVSHSTRLLRSAIWGGRLALHRVTAVQATLGETIAPGSLLVAAFARLVVVGGDGARLHEEVIVAGRELPERGRSRRIELDANRYTALRGAVEAALDPSACVLAPDEARARMAGEWSDLSPLVSDDLDRRAAAQVESLERTFERRRARAVERTDAVFERLGLMLRRALEDPGARQLSFEGLTDPERMQFERDRRAWQDRLDGLEDQRQSELETVARRYDDIRALVFPFAVVGCVPG
jgi:superfamily II DNA or RNA helicase